MNKLIPSALFSGRYPQLLDPIKVKATELHAAAEEASHHPEYARHVDRRLIRILTPKSLIEIRMGSEAYRRAESQAEMNLV